MRIKNKALACLIIMAMLCSVLYTGISAEETVPSESPEIAGETVKSAPENVRDLLQVLALLDRTESGSSGYVSRAVAADVSLRFDKLNGSGTASGNMYIDVSADTPYAYEIETVSAFGYFVGTGGGKFNPEGNITPMQMATVLLRLAGYPENYIQSSSILAKLISGVESYDRLSYPELANMLYAFLDENVLKVVEVVSDKRAKSGDTVLNFFFDTYKFKGVVTENGITGLWSGSDLNENGVVVSGSNENLLFDKGETDIDLMIGRYVEVYYRTDDNNWAPVCVYYDPMNEKNRTSSVDLFDIDFDTSSEGEIEYHTGEDKTNKIKYNEKTAVLYNGAYYDDRVSFLNKIKGKEGTISVLDNNNDGMSDILNIEAYDTFIANSVVLSTDTLYFKNTVQSLSLKRDDYDQFVFKDADGNNFFIEDLVDGMVVSVAQSSVGSTAKTIKVLVSDKTENGTVTLAYQNDSGRQIIQLDNIDEYMLLDNVAVPNIGQGVIAVLDVFGKVAMIDYSNSGEFAYGIITSVAKKQRDEGVLIKMITAQNTIQTFEVTDILNVDKTAYKNMDALYNKLLRTDNVSVGDQKLPAGVYPVRYKLRTDGTLAELDTDTCDIAAGENENTLEFLESGTRMLQRELVMGGSFAIKSSTPVFRIYGSSSEGVIMKEFFDDTKYTAMSNVSALMGVERRYNYAAYKVDEDSLYADFLIISSGWGQAYEDKLFVIEKITEVYDDTAGQVLQCVHGFENGTEKQVLISEFYKDTFNEIGLGCGDVIRYDTDGYGHLIYVEETGGSRWVVKHKLSDPGEKVIDINNISSGRTSLSDFRNDAYSTQMIFGYVKERRGNYVTLAVVAPNTHNLDGKRSAADMGKETVLIKIPDSAALTVFDPTRGDKVYAGTYDEILDYKHNGSNCSLMAIHFRTSRLLDAVVLNDYSLYQ